MLTTFPQPLRHKLIIAEEIRRKIKAGVSMKVILDDIQRFDGAPTSMPSLYKVYRNDIAEARSDVHERVGAVVVNKALDGDMKAAELFLRSKAGWNPTIKVEEVDPEEANEDTGAIDELLALLNMKAPEKDEDAR